MIYSDLFHCYKYSETTKLTVGIDIVSNRTFQKA